MPDLLQNVTLVSNKVTENALTYPVAWAALIRSVILCAVAFGMKLSSDQVASLMLVVESLLAVFTHQAVTPNVRVNSVTVKENV